MKKFLGWQGSDSWHKMIDRDFELLSELVNTPGLPGREQPVADVLQSKLPSKSWQVSSDVVGNLIARKPGKGLKIMLLAHMDEVGLIVRRITTEGFLQVERLGGISLQALPGTRMDLWSDAGSQVVHVGLPAAHLVHGNETDIKLESMFIDAGTRSNEAARKAGIRVGDGLTWHSPLRKTGVDLLSGKALDNRTGCFCLIKLAEMLAKVDLDEDVTLAFITQEECMVTEAAPVVRAMAPDVLIGIDGTLTFDTPDVQNPQCDIKLGNGPCLKMMDVIRGKTAYLPDWGLTRRIRDYMKEQLLSYQAEVVNGLSTTISLMPFMGHGIKSAAVSLPIRYHHSPVETIDENDLYAIINLLFRLLSEKVLVEDTL